MATKSPLEEKVIIQQHIDLESPLYNHHHHRHRCCFNLPCFSSSTSTHLITLGSTGPTTATSTHPFWARLWAPPLWAFNKVREWSEIVAGPKWKTFIRRFNRRSRHTHHHNRHHNNHQFQYDPLSYALNFDEGQGQNCLFDEHDNDVALPQHNPFPDSCSRLPANPNSPFAKVAVNLGNDASQ